MPQRVPKYDLSALCKICSDGDLEVLQVMLVRDDHINGFQGDLNAHHNSYNALHCAAAGGQLECVESLLAANADPHVRTRMPYGREASDGRTAAEIADEWGWDDIVDLLRAAENVTPKGLYVAGGPFNNAKIYPSTLTAEGRKPAESRLVAENLKAMAKPFFKEQSEGTSALLFPGWGSHHVGMLRGASEMPHVSKLIESAKSTLGWDVADVCINGPESRFTDTSVCFAALFLANVAYLEHCRRSHPEFAARPDAVAGIDVGIFASFVAAGVLEFADGLRLASAIGKALDESSTCPQALVSVAGLKRSKLENFCEKVRSESGSEGSVLVISAEYFSKGFTIAGQKELVEKIEILVKEAGAVQCRLVHAPAFNTPLMANASEVVASLLEDISPKMKPLQCDIYLPCCGQEGVFTAGSSPRALFPILLRQLTEPVSWESCVRKMIKAGLCEFFEVGPMRQLRSIMRRIDKTAFERTRCIEFDGATPF